MDNEEIVLCGENELHEANIALAKSNLPDDELIYDAAELFKVFGDSTRMKILYLLLECELCVCDIVAAWRHPVGGLASIADTQAKPADPLPQAGQKRVLLFGG